MPAAKAKPVAKVRAARPSSLPRRSSRVRADAAQSRAKAKAVAKAFFGNNFATIGPEDAQWDDAADPLTHEEVAEIFNASALPESESPLVPESESADTVDDSALPADSDALIEVRLAAQPPSSSGLGPSSPEVRASPHSPEVRASPSSPEVPARQDSPEVRAAPTVPESWTTALAEALEPPPQQNPTAAAEALDEPCAAEVLEPPLTTLQLDLSRGTADTTTEVVPRCRKCKIEVNVLDPKVRIFTKQAEAQCACCGRRQVGLIRLFGTSYLQDFEGVPEAESAAFWNSMPSGFGGKALESYIVHKLAERKVQ